MKLLCENNVMVWSFLSCKLFRFENELVRGRNIFHTVRLKTNVFSKQMSRWTEPLGPILLVRILNFFYPKFIKFKFFSLK